MKDFGQVPTFGVNERISNVRCLALKSPIRMHRQYDAVNEIVK